MLNFRHKTNYKFYFVEVKVFCWLIDYNDGELKGFLTETLSGPMGLNFVLAVNNVDNFRLATT